MIVLKDKMFWLSWTIRDKDAINLITISAIDGRPSRRMNVRKTCNMFRGAYWPIRTFQKLGNVFKICFAGTRLKNVEKHLQKCLGLLGLSSWEASAQVIFLKTLFSQQIAALIIS